MQHWNEPAIRFAEDILVLCNKVDPAMEEETKIEHVIGGLKKEYSFALYLNPPKTTDDLLVVCKKMDSFEKKYRERVEKSRNLYNGPRYSRPQQQSRYVPPTAARNYQTTSTPQAPVSNNYKNDSPPTPRQYRNNFPQPSTPRRPYNPNFVPKPNLQRNTYNKSQEVSKNRTEDGRPICFKCNKPGHVARYCRVKFIRILEEDPADTQEKVEEKCQMNEISEKSGPRLYADIFRVGRFKLSVAPESVNQSKSTINGIKKLDPKYKLKINVDKIGTFEALVDTGADLSVVDLRTALDTGHGISKLAKICAGPDGKKLDMVGKCQGFHCTGMFHKLIKALVETEDGEYIIEESSKMFQTNGLRLARSLINVINRETHIWITNPYPRPLKIMKNQTLAFGSSPAKINVSREREVEKNEEPRFQINENLSPKEQNELKQVLERYGDLFSSRLGRTNLAKHRIDTEDAKPIKHKPYRVSAKERDIIKEQIDEMLTEGIIRPSSSPWSFPVILVKKRDGKYRFCVDYRKLNNVTVKDVYPIPRIDEVMDTLQGSTHFSAIDLRSGYWQVEVEERDKEKKAFTTAHGLYEFNVMPFGLCNAPATFERNMENMLGNLRWQICLCYLDDVIIYSPDFPTHLKRLEAVFRCFRESNLRLNDKKCRFAFEELEILGYITSKHGIKPAEHNIKAVRNFPRPKKVKEVQSFLGMCSYYRKFIKDFSKIADPLTNLIKKSVSFTWTERQEEAFQTLKTALLSPPILGHFNPNAPTYVHTDASNIGIGATLVQDIGGEEKVISYLSRTLSKAEQNYSTTEKECLAVVWSMSKLRPYLYGRHFKIVTDHHALCWLKNLKDPTANFPFERIGIDFVGPLPSTKNRKKWIIVLTDYYTRYAETRAVSEATVKEVSKFLVEDIFLRHGAPQYLISDRGSQFTSNLMKEVMKTCKIKHCFTTSYHPQTNGLTERLNRTLINIVAKNWDEILPFITHAYNTTIQETTGYSPFFLMFGREPTSLLDDRNISVDIDKDDYDEYIKHHLDKINRTRKLVINNTIKTQERMKKNYDKKHMERSYEPGELVAVWTPIRKIGKCEKLLRKYFGPYRILKKLSNVNYLIEPKDNPGQDPLIVHVSRLKPYFERIDERMTEAEDEYVADALTNMQPHCDELVSRLADAIRGQAVPRAEEAIISSFRRIPRNKQPSSKQPSPEINSSQHQPFQVFVLVVVMTLAYIAAATIL
ncbi:K02A2.6-like, partial [Cordylochernes scorpioides]